MTASLLPATPWLRSRRAGAVAALSGGLLALTSAACSSSETPSAAAPYALSGLYAELPTPDGGIDDSMPLAGNVLRFEGNRYSLRQNPCALAADGDPADPTIDDGCTSYGTFALSSDATTLSLTDDATGETTTTPFQPLSTDPPPALPADLADDGDGGVVPQSEHVLDLVTAVGNLVHGGTLSLVSYGGPLYQKVPCGGILTTKTGAATGAFIRDATDPSAGYTCIDSTVTLPYFPYPAAANGGPYCSPVNGVKCTVQNGGDRHGTPYVYYTFVSGSARVECGFQYGGGVATASNGESHPRWTPYIRETAPGIGQTPDESRAIAAPGSVDFFCGIDPKTGLVEMRLDGQIDANFHPKISFLGKKVSVFRITALAWTTEYGAFSCLDPMTQLGPVTYTNTKLCAAGSSTPSVPFVTSAHGNATATFGNDGTTHTPSTECVETQNGATDTDVLYPGQ